MRNLQEQVKKALCYQKLFCPFTVQINCSKAHSLCKKCLHNLHCSLKKESFTPNLSKLTTADVSCHFMKTRSLCRTVYLMNRFLWSQKFCKFSAFSFEFQMFFWITRTIFFLTVGQNNLCNKVSKVLGAYQTSLGKKVSHV